MFLEKLLKDIYAGEALGAFGGLDVKSISCDSRKVEKDSLFVALKGAACDGADFIKEAVNRGSKVVVTNSGKENGSVKEDVCYLEVENTYNFLRAVTEKFYGNPSEKVRTIGITGTNGKTTITYLVESILKEAGISCGVTGTVNYRIGENILSSGITTPGFVDNQRFLSEMADQGIEYSIMEASSHALEQGRVDSVNFRAAIFTNLTSDHMDYHKTKENYFLAKSKLFSGLSGDALSVINIDDPYGQRLMAMVGSRIISYGVNNDADVMAAAIHLNIAGTEFQLISPKGQAIIHTRLVGIYNVYNILAAAAVCLSEGIGLDTIRHGIASLPVVPGRLEVVDYGQDYSIFIDYAHTQDALENLLRAIKDVSTSRIILVFGCGGSRDKTKRFGMGTTAGQYADFSIVTTDNPREEDPQAIIDQIVPGFKTDNYKVILGRKEAIYDALGAAQTGDIVLVVGKGHEKYQILKDKTIEFDEKKIIKEYICNI